MTRVPHWVARVAPGAGAALALGGGAAALYGGLGTEPAGAGCAAGVVLLALGALALVLASRGPTVEEWRAAGSAVLILILLSGVSHRTFFHLTSWEISGAWPYFLVAGLLVARWLAAAPERRAPWLLVLAQVALTATFFDATQGGLPTRDDHPSFLYRFHLLRESFPHLVFYNTQWNGGYLVYEIVATGALSPFLLALPFVYLAPMATLFAAAIPYFFVVLLPWLGYAAMRMLGVGRTGAALGAVLALSPTTVVFLYSLRYGIYPFVISCTLALLATAFFARIFLDGRASLTAAAGLVGATSLCVFWPLGALMVAPVAGLFVLAIPRLDRRRWLLAVGSAVALGLLNTPWVWELARWGDSARFVVEQKSPLAVAGISWSAAATTLRRVVEELHPVSLVLAPVGIVVAASSGTLAKRLLLPTLLLWNLTVAVLGAQLKEQVALERFSLSFSLFAAAGAAIALDGMLERTTRPVGVLVAGVILSMMLMGTLNAGQYYRNRGHYRYEVLPDDLARTMDAIREHCPVDRRVLVPGFSLHWFGGGHIAALPLLAGRSFVGNDFYHRRDYNDAVPPAYRSPSGLGDFLDLYDAGCVLTWNDAWREQATKSPRLTPVRVQDDGVALFTVDGAGSRFVRGHGTVHEDLDRVIVESDDDDVVVKYRFVPGLRTEPAVPFEPFPAYGNVSFIRLRLAGVRRVAILH